GLLKLDADRAELSALREPLLQAGEPPRAQVDRARAGSAEEAVSVSRRGDGAGGERAAQEAIPAAGDRAVDRVANRPGHDDERGEKPPRKAHAREDAKHRVRAQR